MTAGWWDRFHQAYPHALRQAWELFDRFADRDLTTLSHKESVELQESSQTLLAMVTEHTRTEGAPPPVELT